MQLPEDLRTAIEALVSGQPTQDLARHYQTLSERYRRETTLSSFQIASQAEALAYAAARMPATYGAASHVYRKIKNVLPGFEPRTLLDLGAGPGTAALAASELWPEIATRLVEPNPHLAAIASQLCSALSLQANLVPQALAQTDLSQPHDLVTASYVLNEIPKGQLEHEITRLWQATGSTLILIEPGTPLGYEIILQARTKLIALGAHIAAPCPHEDQCPLAPTERWCHISTRIERSSLHRRIKDNAALGYEDEKFSYLVATRLYPEKIKARLLGHPHGQKLISLELCQADGTATTVTLSKRDELYKASKKLKWGDAI